MNLVARYDVLCPHGHTTSLLEKTLRQITANLQELNKAGPQITFVCWHCKTAFRFDYLNRKPAEEIDEPPHSSEPFVCVVTTKCGKPDCALRVELVAVAKSGTTAKQFETEVHDCDWTKFYCEKRHSLAGPMSVRKI